MMFVVTRYPLGEVDVRLARETKNKIRRIAYWSVAAAGAASIAWTTVQTRTENTSDSNE